MGAFGLAGALRFSTNCFTAGHQILALPLGVTVADVALGTSDETSGWRAEYLIGAGVAIAVGMTGWGANAANAGDCWRKPATTCMVSSGNQTRDMTSTMTTTRCGKQSPWTTRKPLFGRMNRSCQTRTHSMSQQPPLVTSDSEQIHSVACLRRRKWHFPLKRRAPQNHPPPAKRRYRPSRSVNHIAAVSGWVFHSSLLSSASSRRYLAGPAPTA